MPSVGRIRYTLTASRFKRERSTVERSRTRAMRGLSRKWVWLCAVERTPERSRSAFCAMRAAARGLAALHLLQEIGEGLGGQGEERSHLSERPQFDRRVRGNVKDQPGEDP